MLRQTKLKAALFEKKMTQRKLSQGTGIPENYISRFLSGRFILTQEEKQRIADAIGQSTETLFKG